MFAWLAVGMSGIMYVSVSRTDRVRLSAFFKFLTIAVLLVALMYAEGISGLSISAKWVALGLLLSLVGDQMFMLPRRFYRYGIPFFVLVSICYSKAFWLQIPGELSLWLPSMLYAAIVIVFLVGLPKLSAIVIPVAIFGTCLVQMAWAAAEVWMQLGTVQALYGCLGASLLLLSSVGHAFKHKDLPAKNGNILLDSGYFISQALITASAMG